MPGNGYEVKSVNMDFHYTDLDNIIYLKLTTLILDCMAGDSTLFMDGPPQKRHGSLYNQFSYWKTTMPSLWVPSGSWGQK